MGQSSDRVKNGERKMSLDKAMRIVMKRPRYWDRQKITEEMYQDALSKYSKFKLF
jgi:hypothetical protein